MVDQPPRITGTYFTDHKPFNEYLTVDLRRRNKAPGNIAGNTETDLRGDSGRKSRIHPDIYVQEILYNVDCSILYDILDIYQHYTL